MRLTIVAVALLTITGSARAQSPSGAAAAHHHWITAVPRAVGRNFKDTFTFKYPLLTMMKLANWGAVSFDQQTTLNSFSKCASCREITWGPYYNRRWSKGTGVAMVILMGTIETTIDQYGFESSRNNPHAYWRFAGSTIPAGAFTSVHVIAGIDNMRTLDHFLERER